jgi:hypothetical protein
MPLRTTAFSTGANAANPASITVPGTVQVGDVLCIVATTNDSNTDAATVTGGGVSAWHLRSANPDALGSVNSVVCYTATATASTAGSAISISFSGTTSGDVDVAGLIVMSGVYEAGLVFNKVVNAASSASVTFGSVAMGTMNTEVAALWIATADMGTLTPPSGTTVDATKVDTNYVGLAHTSAATGTINPGPITATTARRFTSYTIGLPVIASGGGSGTASSVVRSTSSNSSSLASNTSASVTIPAGAVSGDELLLVLGAQNTAGSITGFTAPAGWTLLAGPVHTSTSGFGTYAVYRATYGTDVTGTTSFTWTNSGYYAFSCVALIGNAINGSPTVGTTVTDTTTVQPYIATSGTEFVAAFAGFSNVLGGSITWGSGWVNEASVGSGRVQVGIAAFNTVPAGTGEVAETATSSGSSNDCFGVLVKYAAIHNYTASPADTENITDARSFVQSQARTLADTENITGTATPQQDNVRSSADTVGLTDAVAVNHEVKPADTVAITDVGTAIGAGTAQFSDAENISGATTVIQANVRAPADTVGLTDQTSAQRSKAASPADNIGLTDAVTVVQGNRRTAADTIGITDAEAVFGQLTQVITTTAEPDIEARGVPLTDVANLSGTAGLTLDASPAPDLVVGPQRAVIEIDAGTTELTHVIALSGTAGLELATHPRLHVVARMTDILSEQVVGVIQPMTLRNDPIWGTRPLISDDFTTQDTVKWSWEGATFATGGQAHVPCTIGYVNSLRAVSFYDLTGQTFGFELVQAVQETFTYMTVTGGGYFWDVRTDTGTINAGWDSGGVRTWLHPANGDAATWPPYDPTVHRWLRHRESGGVLFWEYSSDNITWALFASGVPPFLVNSVQPGFGCGGASTGEAVIANVNVASAATGVQSGSLGPTDKQAWRLSRDPYGQAVRTSAPAAWWRLFGSGRDEIGGATAVPTAVATGSATTISYGSPLVGPLGRCAQLDGSGFFLLPSGTAADTGEPLTLEGWVTHSNTSEFWGTAFGNRNYLVEHRLNNFAVYTAGDTDEFGSTVWVPDQPYHLAAVWDTDNTLRFYVNGVLETNGWPVTISGFPTPDPGGFKIGTWKVDPNPGLSQPWYGSVQDVAVYHRALSAAEVHAHYQAGLVAFGDLAADIFDDIPVATVVTVSVWMRASAPATVALDVADAAGVQIIGGPWSNVLADTGWHKWTQTFTTAADWVKNVHALRAPLLPAGVDWIEWSDPTITVATPRSLSVVPKPEPEQPTPRRLSRVFTVLR